MQKMSTWHGRQRPIGFSVARAAAMLMATAILVAACGGDSGNGGVPGVLHVMVVNASDADVTISYTGDEPAADESPADQPSDDAPADEKS